MVQLLIGHKGSGKTKQMCDLANEKVANAQGSVVFMSKSDRLNTDLMHNIRLVSMGEYKHITDSEEYIGFIYGILASDHDIEYIFIDSILSHADISAADLPGFINRLGVIEKEDGIKFVVSGSCEKEEIVGLDLSVCEIIE